MPPHSGPAGSAHPLQRGGLATGGYGSAIGAIRAAAEDGKMARVWVDETRPLLQGTRLTAWELKALGIPHAVIMDSRLRI